MPKFKVTYKCPKGDYESIIEGYYASWSQAMLSVSPPCPGHAESGDLRAYYAVEVKEIEPSGSRPVGGAA